MVFRMWWCMKLARGYYFNKVVLCCVFLFFVLLSFYAVAGVFKGFWLSIGCSMSSTVFEASRSSILTSLLLVV